MLSSQNTFCREELFLLLCGSRKPEVNKFVDTSKQKFIYKSAFPEQRYILDATSSLVKQTYSSATGPIGKFYTKLTKNQPGYALLFISFIKLVPNNSLN